jgi:hypothetical protein
MKTRSRFAAVAVTAALAVSGVAACSSSSSGGGGSNASSGPVAQIASLHGEHTQVVLAPSFLAALTSLKVTPGLVGDATLKNGTLTFPITGGNVTYYKPGSRSPYVTGEIDHNGSGLTLSAGGKTVKLENFVVNPGTSKLTGTVVEGGKTLKNVYLFFLNGSTLQPLTTDSSNNTATLYGTKVYLSPDAATALNQYFGITALNSSVFVGTARIVVSTTSA